MTKKDFKTGVSPATFFIGTAEAEAPAPEPKKLEDATKAQRKGTETNAQNHKETTRAKVETKSKRLNLLLQPSLLEDLSKIATMNKDSVNNLINSALIDYRDAHKDIIEKYNKVFEG